MNIKLYQLSCQQANDKEQGSISEENLLEESPVLYLQPSVFDCSFNEPLIHQVVTAVLAGARQGTHAQKTRGEVRGGGKKPWRQKGTGRARAGSIRSPLWRKGGVTFAAQSQDYAQKVNKKMYRAALRSILSELVRSERLIAVDIFTVVEAKTRVIAAQLKSLGLEQVTIITQETDEQLERAARNLPQVVVCTSSQMDPVSLIRYPKVLITRLALKEIEKKLL